MNDAGSIPPATPRPAATAMLLRQADDAVEVLLIRRHEQLKFMGGLWVFPGGTLCPADLSDAALARVPPAAAARCNELADLNGAALPRRECLGLAIAAIRETFEETGVLLATTAQGIHCGNDLSDRLQEQRRAVNDDAARFAAMLCEHDLHLEVDRLLYWAHWVTPSSVPRRFDTRFFAIALAAAQTARIDSIEAVEHAWLTPADAIAAAAGGAMPLSRPTLYNLLELQSSLSLHGSLAGLVAREARRSVAPILPKIIRNPDPVMVLPWDAQYAQLPGSGTSAGVEYSQQLRALPSRMSVPH